MAINRSAGSAVAGGLSGYSERNDDSEYLPSLYRKSGGIGLLVKCAEPLDLYVSALGGERYLIADNRGHILVKSVGFAEAYGALKACRRAKP